MAPHNTPRGYGTLTRELPIGILGKATTILDRDGEHSA
jgi:hypothetical protein